MSRGGSSRPVPGRQYVVTRNEDGMTYEDIGVLAYGKTGMGPQIWGANKPRTSNKVKKGDVLIIPGERPAVKLVGREPYAVTCIIGGREVTLAAGKILRTMDTGADGWSGRIPWTPGADPQLDRVTRPFGYERAAVYVGNALVVSGCLYTVTPEMTTEGMTKGLAGYSFTADAIDSSLMPPYERNNVSLLQLAFELSGYFGISVRVDPSVVEGKRAAVNAKGEVLLSYSDFKKGYDPFGGKFERVTADEGTKVFEHLAKLAAQRGVLLSCTNEGDFLFLKARTRGEPVGTIEEGQPFATGWKAEYEGRKLFHTYKLITAGVKGRGKAPERWVPGAPPKHGKTQPSTISEVDNLVPRSRFTTFRADDVTPGNIKNAARWKRTKQFVEALSLPFPVTTWYAPNGKLWEVNTLVTVVSPTLGVPKGFTFVIRSVEFEWEARKQWATLNLVPPQAYSGKDLENIWT